MQLVRKLYFLKLANFGLLLINIFLIQLLLAITQRSLNHEPQNTPVLVPRVKEQSIELSADNSSNSAKEDIAASEVKKRIRDAARKIAENKYVEFLKRPQIERVIKGLVSETTIDYADFFQQFPLDNQQLERLCELIALRGLKIDIPIYPPESFKIAALPAKFVFGAEMVDAKIQSEFGAPLLEQLKHYEAILPAKRLTNEISENLEVYGCPLNADQRELIVDILKKFPSPKNLKPNASEQEQLSYINAARERNNGIVNEAMTYLSPNQHDRVKSYFLQQEELILSRQTIQKTTIKRTGR